MEQAQQPAFKLNLKRTFLIGFAFFGILLLWQVYDSWCPPLLTELFKNSFVPLKRGNQSFLTVLWGYNLLP